MNRRPRSRAGRTLMWVLLIILALIVLSLLFGGFQKGSKSALAAPGSQWRSSASPTAPPPAR